MLPAGNTVPEKRGPPSRYRLLLVYGLSQRKGVPCPRGHPRQGRRRQNEEKANAASECTPGGHYPGDSDCRECATGHRALCRRRRGREHHAETKSKPAMVSFSTVFGAAPPATIVATPGGKLNGSVGFAGEASLGWGFGNGLRAEIEGDYLNNHSSNLTSNNGTALNAFVAAAPPRRSTAACSTCCTTSTG